jgi:hypothetical protein
MKHDWQRNLKWNAIGVVKRRAGGSNDHDGDASDAMLGSLEFPERTRREVLCGIDLSLKYANSQ